MRIGQAAGDAAAEPEQRALAHLVEELGAAAPHQRLGAVDEGRVCQPVVHERRHDRREPRAGVGVASAALASAARSSSR